MILQYMMTLCQQLLKTPKVHPVSVLSAYLSRCTDHLWVPLKGAPTACLSETSWRGGQGTERLDLSTGLFKKATMQTSYKKYGSMCINLATKNITADKRIFVRAHLTVNFDTPTCKLFYFIIFEFPSPSPFISSLMHSLKVMESGKKG